MSIVVTIGERTASSCRPALAVTSDALRLRLRLRSGTCRAKLQGQRGYG
jgi:hypothetical protein